MHSMRVHIFGIVQGVGFRPFIHRLAMEHQVRGTVANKGSYVEVYLQANSREEEDAFINDIAPRAPERSLIMKISREETDLPPFTDFAIIESEREDGDIFVSPDIATCPSCQEELFDPDNRRYLHPFINCTACGPRLTILDSMPYDRERTSMKNFPMCPTCQYEYTHAETRRYDAQPVCCNDCGPKLSLYALPSFQKLTNADGSSLSDFEAISRARAALMQGKIVAIKGIGGFHLACDATNDEAVRTLRERKKRPTKPFAVMFRYLSSLSKYCQLGPLEEKHLSDWQRPIVLLNRTSAPGLSPLLAPGNPMLGAMLPYTPLHLLIFSLPDGLAMTEALVMTSGNISGAPICYTLALVRKELSDICDLVLSHNRNINLRCDDSVLLVERTALDGEGEVKTSLLRRSRGYAPLPQVLSKNWRGEVLGIGSELKNTFCLGKNDLFYLSPHIGDLSDIRCVMALRETLLRLEDLLEIRPKVVACDSHPRYNSTEQARALGIPTLTVQHHYAHVLSCMAENDCLSEVLGVSFDGTGDGQDGTIWGGEIMRASLSSFERLASLEPFPHTGGDIAAREGFRIAISFLEELFGEVEAATMSPVLGLAEPEGARIQALLTKRGLNTVLTTSAGRLFDAVSALLGFARTSSFEGEAASLLQFAAERALKKKVKRGLRPLKDELIPGGPHRASQLLPIFKLVRKIVERALKGEDKEELALYFHQELAAMIVEACIFARDKTGIATCALTGGVFQNRLLAALCENALTQAQFTVLRHRLVPANDGGLALGQAVYAMAWLQDKDL